MPRDDENIHVEATPHFDGQRESILNDPTASASSTMGIFDTKETFAQEKNPFNYTPKPHPDMERLGELIRGKKVED